MAQGESTPDRVFRDAALVAVGWALGVGFAAGAIGLLIAGRVAVALMLGIGGAVFVALRLRDVPRVELHSEQLVVRHVASTQWVPYAAIRGVSVDTLWWAGRSSLFLTTDDGRTVRIPAGVGLGPPQWHLELREELRTRTGRDLL